MDEVGHHATSTPRWVTIATLLITHMSCGEDGAGLTWFRAVMPFQQNMHCTKMGLWALTEHQAGVLYILGITA